MTFLKSALATGALAAALAAGSMVPAASAAVACNAFGECWHTDRHVAYPANVGVTWHADNWARFHHRDYHWRGYHDGRGYWRNGIWITF